MKEKYIAFISYRHKPLDIQVAKRLHRLIERYRIPSDLRKGDEIRLGRVFRDRDELPLSSDLSADIKSALDSSRFLIVVCTPDTPESPWVRREITYFLEHHDLNHVLVVLADGSPEESFPEQITHVYGKDGITLERIVEPLAANIAAPMKVKRYFLLNAEFLRLAAVILDCPYDALKQRDRRYRQQKISMAAIAVAVIAIGFIGMLARKNHEIQEQNEEIRGQNEKIQEQKDEIQAKNEEITLQMEQAQRNESYALSLLSGQLLEEGDRDGAVENAINALPSASGERPLSTEAELALVNGLYAYQDAGLRAGCRLEQDTDIEDMLVSRDGHYAITIDEYLCLRVYNGYSGELLWERSDLRAYKKYLAILESEKALLYFWYGKYMLFSLQDGTVLKEAAVEGGEEISVSDSEKIVAFPIREIEADTRKYDCFVKFYRMPEFNEILQTSVIDIGSEHISFVNGCFSQDESRYAVEFEDEAEDGEELEEEGRKIRHHIHVLDVTTGDCLYSLEYEERDKFYAMDMVFLPEGDLVVLRTEWGYEPVRKRQYLERFDRDTGEAIYSQEFSDEYTSLHIKMLLGSYELLCADIGGKELIRFDLSDGKVEECTELSSECMDCYWLDESHKEYAVVLRDGSVEIRNRWSFKLEDILLNVGYNLSQACAYGDEEGTDYICMVPEGREGQAIFYRYCGDEQKESVLVPSEKFGRGKLYMFPSGDRAAYVRKERASESTFYRIVIYDDSLKKEINRYEFESEDSLLEFMGFSKDESKLIFNGYSFDMETEECMLLPEGEGISSYVLFYDYGKPYEQTVGRPVMLAYLGDMDRDAYMEIYWWEDGEYGQSISPYRGWDYHNNWAYNRILAAAGESGLMVAPIKEVYENNQRPDAYVIYSREDDTWTRLENPCQENGFPVYCIGNENPWAAFCDYDGMLRIADGKTGKIIRTFPLGMPADAVEEAQFLLDDTVLLLRQSNSLVILDTSEGGKKIAVDLTGFSEESELSVQTDKAGNSLYIGERNGNIDGVCIDLKTWKVRAVIPGFIAFSPSARRVIKWDAVAEEYVSYPAYTVQELVEKGEKFLLQ